MKNIKEKIVNFFKKIKNFSLLDYLLNGKIRTIKNDIELKGMMVVFHQNKIKDAEKDILKAKKSITKLKSDINDLYDYQQKVNVLWTRT